MDEPQVVDATARAPRVVAILDPSVQFARLIELLVRERFPASPVRAFADRADARRWIAEADAPAIVIADVAAGGGEAVQLAASWSSRAGRVTVGALVSPEDGRARPHEAAPKPDRLEAWRICLRQVLVS